MKWCLVLGVLLAWVALPEIYALPLPEEKDEAPTPVADEELRSLFPPTQSDSYETRGRKRIRYKIYHRTPYRERHSYSSSKEHRKPYRRPKKPAYSYSSSSSHHSDSYDSRDSRSRSHEYRHRYRPYEICVKMPKYHYDY